MKPKPSFAQTLRENRIAERNLAIMSEGIFDKHREIPALLKPAVTRKRAEPVAGVQIEADILKAILMLLKRHPKVGKAWRVNSGTFTAEYAGKTRYIRSNTARGMSDIAGILKGGRGLYIEVKRPGQKLMEHQAEFLAECSRNGALAFMATSVEDVLKALSNE